MKILLKYDLRIQQTVILLFIATLLMALIIEIDSGFTVILIEFFLIAFVQYTLNLLKFYKKHYPRTQSRTVYIFVSSYVVITFLFFVLRRFLNLDFYCDFIDWMPLSWIILSPVLILQSLIISFYDKEKLELKDN
ncbi:hypothetical protein [Chryseobacterium lineare]